MLSVLDFKHWKKHEISNQSIQFHCLSHIGPNFLVLKISFLGFLVFIDIKKFFFL